MIYLFLDTVSCVFLHIRYLRLILGAVDEQVGLEFKRKQATFERRILLMKERVSILASLGKKMR